MGSPHALSSNGSGSNREASQHLSNRAATIKMSGVPSLRAEAAFDFLGVRLTPRSALACHVASSDHAEHSLMSWSVLCRITFRGCASSIKRHPAWFLLCRNRWCCYLLG